ncbi:hypothetical protein Agub_g12845, partial [Astrephomene gubernaculifera]
MGIISKFKTLLKTSSVARREDDDEPACLTHYVRPASVTTPRTVALESNHSRSGMTAAINGNAEGSPRMVRRIDSARCAVPRIDSITTTTTPGSRFETTIITRQGSRVVLQGVKTMKPESDDEADDSPPCAATPGGPASPSPASPRPPSPPSTRPASGAHAHALVSSGSFTHAHHHPHHPGLSSRPTLSPKPSFTARSHLSHAPNPQPPSAGTPQLPAVPGATPVPPASPAPGDAPAVRRKPNRVASLPMLLDGGVMSRPPAPFANPHDDGISAAPVSAAASQQEAAAAAAERRPPRRLPKRSESLKYLLNLDQYRFNQDVSVQEAREAACGLLADPSAAASSSRSASRNASGTGMLPAGGSGGGSSHLSGSINTGVTLASSLAADKAASALGSGSSHHQHHHHQHSPLQHQGSLEDIISTDGTTTSILAVSPALPARMRRPRWSLEDYQLLKQLHRGYASDVFQAVCKVSGEMVALKVYKLAEQGDIQRMQLYREIKLHAGLRHSNIVQYYACFLEQQRVILVTEFCTGGDLLRIMYKCGGRLFERQAVNMVLQPFLTALHYLHTQGIVHRDIKPENVLFAEGKILKLADFGLAISLKEERANTRAGTLDYMAPEVLRCPTKKTPDENKGNPQSAHYHQAVDAWAVGVFAYELIVGAPPFKAAQMIDTARNIMHAPVAFPPAVSELARDFIMRALHKDPLERSTVLEMLHHPWITMFQRRSSVRIVYTRSNSLMELMPPEQRQAAEAAAAAAAGGGVGGGGGAAHQQHRVGQQQYHHKGE